MDHKINACLTPLLFTEVIRALLSVSTEDYEDGMSRSIYAPDANNDSVYYQIERLACEMGQRISRRYGIIEMKQK